MALESIFVISDQTDALEELCFGAKKLAEKVTAVVFGDQAAAESAAVYGADAILYCPIDSCAPEDYCKAIATEIKKSSQAVVMLSNTIRCRCMAGKIGVYLDTAVLTAVSEITLDDEGLLYKRTVYGGAAMRCEKFKSPYGVITVAGGVFGDVDATLPPTAEISVISGAPQDSLKCIAHNEKKEGGVNLAAAKRIVDVGRGLAAQEDLDMCRKLASLLDAEVGCSRPVAENNKWMPKNNYLGMTGVVVRPDLCFLLGVSGQVQHIAGIDKSKVIVAINKDKNAPIFKNVDFGLVGDIYKAVPALIEKLS